VVGNGITIVLRTGLYKFRRDRHCHVKKGGMAGLPGKKDGIAGSENPIVDPPRWHMHTQPSAQFTQARDGAIISAVGAH